MEDVGEYQELYETQEIQEDVIKDDSDIWDIICTLSEKEKVVVVLLYYQEFSVKEISRLLSVPEGTVKSRLSTARNNLKIKLNWKG